VQAFLPAPKRWNVEYVGVEGFVAGNIWTTGRYHISQSASIIRIFLWALTLSSLPCAVLANSGLLPAVPLHSTEFPPLPPSQHFAAVVLQEADTGQVLFAQHAERIWPLASLTKMMVGLLGLEAIERGSVALHTPVKISRRASRTGGRTVNLRAGEVLPFGELLQAMLVTSANGAAVAVAEKLSGSVEACVKSMNVRATALGMRKSRFRTVNGLPPRGKTTPDQAPATDMGILAQALLKYPQILQWTSRKKIPFRSGKELLPNTNFLVGRIAGVDGLKTGYTSKARFNLVTTAKRGRLRLIAVVLGGRSSRVRFQTAATLLEWGFANFTRLRLIRLGEPLWAEVQVEHGSVSTLQPIAGKDTTFLVRTRDIQDLQISLQLPAVIPAPVTRHQILGRVVVRNKEQVFAIIPALSPTKIPHARWGAARR
jgi:D-alanyl-D-alanine carboxypeptidase (penicillin-binding protein 5/6)